MVQLVENQPDAYTYRIFGKRVVRGSLLATILFVFSAILIGGGTDGLDELVTTVMEQGNFNSEGIEGSIMKIFFVILVGFMPLTWMAMHIAKSYRKGYKILEADKTAPAGMVTGARVALLLMSTLAIAPIAMAFDAPATVINYYQEWFLRVYFTLLGLGILLLFLAPAITLQRRTGGRGLYLSGLLAIIAGGLIIFHANQAWSASVFDLTRSSDLYIGAHSKDGSDDFNGLIDEFHFYEGALGETQVTSLYYTYSPPHGSSLRSEWEFNEDDGDVAFDDRGENDGRLTNGAWWSRNGRFGGALDCRAQGAVVRVSDHETLDVEQSDSVSFALWFKAESDNLTQYLFFKQSGTGQYHLLLSSGRLTFYIKDIEGQSKSVRSELREFDDGQWHHVVGVINHEEDQLLLYVDGEPEASKSIGKLTSLAGGSGLREFRESYGAIMGLVALLLFVSGLIMRRNSGSILRRQRRFFITHLEG